MLIFLASNLEAPWYFLKGWRPPYRWLDAAPSEAEGRLKDNESWLSEQAPPTKEKEAEGRLIGGRKLIYCKLEADLKEAEGRSATKVKSIYGYCKASGAD